MNLMWRFLRFAKPPSLVLVLNDPNLLMDEHQLDYSYGSWEIHQFHLQGGFPRILECSSLSSFLPPWNGASSEPGHKLSPSMHAHTHTAPARGRCMEQSPCGCRQHLAECSNSDACLLRAALLLPREWNSPGCLVTSCSVSSGSSRLTRKNGANYSDNKSSPCSWHALEQLQLPDEPYGFNDSIWLMSVENR